MKTTLPTSPPPHAFAFLLWFTTLLLGAVPLSIYLALASLKEPGFSLFIPLLSSCFAGLCSLPILPVLPVGIWWAFQAATRQQCWARLLAVLVGLFAAAELCGFWFLKANRLTGNVMALAFATPYLVAAFLAAAFIYRPWLFQA